MSYKLRDGPLNSGVRIGNKSSDFGAGHRALARSSDFGAINGLWGLTDIWWMVRVSHVACRGKDIRWMNGVSHLWPLEIYR